MKNILLLLSLFYLINSASAVVINENIAFIGNGNGYLPAENDQLDHIVVISAGSPNNIMLYDSTGTGSTIAYGNNTFNNPTTCYVAGDGYLYFSSANGVFRKLDRDTSPDDLGKSSEFTVIGTETTVSAWSEDSNYIYYYDKSSKTIKRISKKTYLVSNFKVFSTAYWIPDFYVKDGTDVYFMTGIYTTSTRLYLCKSTASSSTYNYAYTTSASWGTSTNQVYYYGDITYVNDSCIYLMGGAYCTGSIPGFKDVSLKRISDSGTALTLAQEMEVSHNMVTTGMASTPVGRTFGFMGTRQPILFYKDGITINMYETSTLAPGIGSTAGGSTDNPLLDMDGDGEFTQDDAKDMALNLGPFMWIMMFMIFLMVAMGAKR